MKLLANEFLKLQRSKTLKGVMIAFLCLAILAGLVFDARPWSSPVAVYGFGAPFLWASANGACGFFLYALLTAGLIAGEFESGVVHNALGSGVGRGRYFVTKVVTLSVATIVIYLLGICVLCLFKSITNGFDPQGQIFSDYRQKVMAYVGGSLLALLSYLAIFIFIAYLFQESVLSFIICVVLTILEPVIKVRGPYLTILESISYFEEDRILSMEFARLFLPFAGVTALFLGAAYVAFIMKDVD